MVDWGDGTALTTNITSHAYANAGDYQIKMYGDIKRFWNPDTSNNTYSIVSVDDW